jgi:hypothetical protein
MKRRCHLPGDATIQHPTRNTQRPTPKEEKNRRPSSTVRRCPHLARKARAYWPERWVAASVAGAYPATPASPLLARSPSGCRRLPPNRAACFFCRPAMLAGVGQCIAPKSVHKREGDHDLRDRGNASGSLACFILFAGGSPQVRPPAHEFKQVLRKSAGGRGCAEPRENEAKQGCERWPAPQLPQFEDTTADLKESFR